jgi:hypothetical protein
VIPMGWDLITVLRSGVARGFILFGVAVLIPAFSVFLETFSEIDGDLWVEALKVGRAKVIWLELTRGSNFQIAAVITLFSLALPDWILGGSVRGIFDKLHPLASSDEDRKPLIDYTETSVPVDKIVLTRHGVWAADSAGGTSLFVTVLVGYIFFVAVFQNAFFYNDWNGFIVLAHGLINAVHIRDIADRYPVELVEKKIRSAGW